MADPLMIGGIIANILGAASEYRMGMEDREFWKSQSREAGERIDDTTRFLLHGDPTSPYGGYEGLLDIIEQLSPEYAKRAKDVRAGTAGISRELRTGYTGLQKQLGGIASTLGKAYGARTKAIGGGYDKRTSELMDILSGAGQQYRKDIESSSKASLGTILAQLAGGGMGTGGVAASYRAGSERQKQDVLGRLEESLRQQKLNTYGAATSEALGAKATLTGEELASRRGLELERVGLGERAVGAQSDVEKWGLETRTAADQYSLANRERLKMMPLDVISRQTDSRVGAMLNFGLPPSVVPFFSSVGQQLTNMWAAKQANKGQDSQSHGSVSILGTGVGW